MNPVEEFLDIDKQAGFGSFLHGMGSGVGRAPLSGVMTGAEGVGRAIGEQIPLAAAGLLIAGGGGAVARGFASVKDRLTKSRDYKNMVNANPSLKKEPAHKVQMLFDSLRHLSPHMSKDPLIAGSFVRNTIEMSPESGSSIGPQTAKMLADTQKSVAQSAGRNPMIEAMMRGGQWGPTQPERKEMPFEVSPQGLKGRFRTMQEANDYMLHAGIPEEGLTQVRHEHQGKTFTKYK